MSAAERANLIHGKTCDCCGREEPGAKPKRRGRPKVTSVPAGKTAPKKRAIKVSTKETETTHAYRVVNAIATRRSVRLELQGTLFAHIICSDDETCTGFYGVEKMAAYSKTIAPKYKMPVASKRTIDRHRAELVDLGFLSIVPGERKTRMCADSQIRNTKSSSTYTVNTMALDLAASECQAEAKGSRNGTKSGTKSDPKHGSPLNHASEFCTVVKSKGVPSILRRSSGHGAGQ